MSSVLAIFQQIVHVADWCVLAVGMVMCLRYRYLSPWIWLVAAGFAGLVAAGILQTVVIAIVNRLAGGRGAMLLLSAVSVGYLGGMITIVVGLGFTFGDITKRMRMLYHQAHPPAAAAESMEN